MQQTAQIRAVASDMTIITEDGSPRALGQLIEA